MKIEFNIPKLSSVPPIVSIPGITAAATFGFVHGMWTLGAAAIAAGAVIVVTKIAEVA